MKLDNFKELLLRKSPDNQNLEFLIKNIKDDTLVNYILEALEKNEDIPDSAKPKAHKKSNAAIRSLGAQIQKEVKYGDESTTANMFHDQISHHGSHYKAALKAGNTTVADQHMKKLFGTMHMMDKLQTDGDEDHTGGNLKVKSISTHPWKQAHRDENDSDNHTYGWAGGEKDKLDFDHLRAAPSDSKAKHSNKLIEHGHNKSYPLEEISVNGKFIHIDDNVPFDGKFTDHPIDSHPIFAKRKGLNNKEIGKPLYFNSEITPERNAQFEKELQAFHNEDDENSGIVKYSDRVDKRTDEELLNHGKEKSSPVHDHLHDENFKELNLEESAAKHSRKGRYKPKKESVKRTPEEQMADWRQEAMAVKNNPKDQPLTPEKADAQEKAIRERQGSAKSQEEAIRERTKPNRLTPEEADAQEKAIRERMNKSIQTPEDLLKSISGLLNKHKSFLNENPEMLSMIEDRLMKAVDDEYEDEGWDDSGYGEDQMDDMFDPEVEGTYDPDNVDYEDVNSEDDAANKFLANQGSESSKKDTNLEDKPIEDLTEEDILERMKDPKFRAKALAQNNKETKKAGGTWKPKDDHKPEHQEQIDKYIEEGWSPREAERHLDLDDKDADYGYNEPSAKMIEMIQSQGHVKDYLSRVKNKRSEDSTASNPTIHAAHQKKKASEGMHDDFHSAIEEFVATGALKDLKGKDKRVAIQRFEENWHAENPEYREGVVGLAGKHNEINKDVKAKNVQGHEDDENAFATALMSDSGNGVTGEFSSNASGGLGNLTAQGAAQMAGGGSDGEGNFTTSQDENKYAQFARENPEFHQRKVDEFHNRVNNPDRSARFKRLIAKPGKDFSMKDTKGTQQNQQIQDFAAANERGE